MKDIKDVMKNTACIHYGLNHFACPLYRDCGSGEELTDTIYDELSKALPQPIVASILSQYPIELE